MFYWGSQRVLKCLSSLECYFLVVWHADCHSVMSESEFASRVIFWLSWTTTHLAACQLDQLVHQKIVFVWLQQVEWRGTPYLRNFPSLLFVIQVQCH